MFSLRAEFIDGAFERQIWEVGDRNINLLSNFQALEGHCRYQERGFKTVVAVQRHNRLSRRDFREPFDLDAGYVSREWGEKFAAIEVVIGQFELPTRLIKLSLSSDKIGFRLIERGLRGNTPLQKFLSALEVGLRIINCRLSLLHAGVCLIDLTLQ